MSGELLSNDRRAVGFGSSRLGLRDASIRWGCERSGGQVFGRAGRERVQIARLEEGGRGVASGGGGIVSKNSVSESHN